MLQASRLPFPFETSAVSVQGGGPSGNQGSGTYSVDFLGFGLLHQEIGLQGNTSATIQKQSFITGIKLDESRAGGYGRLEWRPFRDLGGTSLAYYLDANHQSVSLERNTGAVLRQDLND